MGSSNLALQGAPRRPEAEHEIRMFDFTKPGKSLTIPEFESAHDIGGELQCPSCGCNYLHHERVEVFDRAEDAATGTHVVVDAGKVEVDNSMIGNPSKRRDGIRIHFSCEGCKDHPYMEIVQHKGNTYVGMGVVPAAQEESALPVART